MIYFLLLLSLTANGILVWYIRTLIKRYLYDVEAIDKFSEMLGQYADSLTSIYKLEELYGDETLKKAIVQTKFVVEACKELNGGFGQPEQRDEEAEQDPEKPYIKIKEGEKISQSAGSYRRIVFDK